jgi:hypothetical protein
MMKTFCPTMKRSEAGLPIKKEIQDFIIATEHLYRFLSRKAQLTPHEGEILRCCLEELSAKRSVCDPMSNRPDESSNAQPPPS